jgi:alkylhydroperoxidase family enzyme
MTSMDQEPRVTRVDPDTADPTLRESFDGFIRARGKVPNLFRIAAHNPPVGRTLSAHLDAVMGPGTVNELLKELCAVRVSQLNGCNY